MYSAINEAKSGILRQIESFCSIMYTHLMKFYALDNMLTGWVGSIDNAINGLSKISNKTFWKDVKSDSIRLNKIRRDAIADFENDGNRNGDTIFTLVYNDFYDIEMFKDREKVKAYIINLCEKKKNLEMQDYVNRRL